MLGYLDEIPVCTGYRIDGEITDRFPVTRLLDRAEPVYRVFPGWKKDIRGIQSFAELPENCRNYVTSLEKMIDCPIRAVSNGPKREEYIVIARDASVCR